MASRILILVISFMMSAQYLSAQNTGSIQRGQRGYVPPAKFSTSAYIEKVDPYEESNRIVEKCQKEFKLDAFQSEILKSTLVKKFESFNAILEDEKNTRDTRKTKITSLENQFLKDLNHVLSPEQVKDFQHMDFEETKEDRKKKKEKKRKKKNKS